MSKIGIRLIVTFLMCGFLLGCASRKDIVQFKDDLLYMRLKMDALQSENEKVKVLLQDINDAIVNLQDESHRTRADLISEMSSLKDRTEFLQSLLDDTGDRMSKLMHSVEDRTTRVPGIELPIDSLSPYPDSTRTMIDPDLNPKQLYDAAYLDLSRGDYDLALQEFREYLRIFPETEYADNAQYWIGEIYYARGNYERSFNEFNKVDSEHTQGDKVAASLLKMGYCLINLKDSSGARQYLNRVIERFPNSPEAGLARNRLQEIR